MKIRKLKSLFVKSINYLNEDETLKGRTQELVEILKSNSYKTFLEVGVYNGDNLLKLAALFPNVRFIGVDPYSIGEYNDRYEKENYDYWEKKHLNVDNKAKKLGNVEIFRMSSLEAVKEFNLDSIDVVFIDAIHTYKDCSQDIEYWKKVVKPGGILSGHDFSLNFFGVVLAVNEKLGIDNVRIGKDSTWFYLKK